jgi:hypothetical protein
MKTTHSMGGMAFRRQAACHRCGWTQPLMRIGRHEQAASGVGHAYRWLCTDCVDDLASVSTNGRERQSEMAEAGRSHHPSRLVA